MYLESKFEVQDSIIRIRLSKILYDLSILYTDSLPDFLIFD